MEKNNLSEVCSETAIEEFLAAQPNWSFVEDRLKANFTLADFASAVRVMNEVFVVATRMDHHPRMTNTYNRLEFSLCTHSAGNKVTHLDLELAQKISELVSQSAN